MCMALIASNVKYVLNHLKRVGLLKDILLCIPKKNLLVISVEESFLQKTIWGCIWKQNMTSKDVDFLRKKLVNSISYFRKILCKAPDVSSVMFVLKTFVTNTILRGIMLFTLEKNLMLVAYAMEGLHRLVVWSSISKLNMSMVFLWLNISEPKIPSLLFRTILFKLQDATNVKYVSKAFETNMCLKGIMLFTQKKNPTFVKYAIEVFLSMTQWKFISEQYTRIYTPNQYNNLILWRQ